MPFDGLVLSAVRKELDEKLSGGRIERIYQPEKDVVLITVHRPGGKYRLLMSANAQNARVHLSTSIKENPVTPPLFCMVLRKHLEGGRINGFAQPGLERILIMKIEARDELGRPSEKHLVCEIMGKHSNIILLDTSNGIILDGIKRYTHAVSRHREVLPGRLYLKPPGQDKLNPLATDEESFSRACLGSPLETTLPTLLQKRFEGLSTITCREIVHRANLPMDTMLDQCGEYEFRSLWHSLQAIAGAASSGIFEPCLQVGHMNEPVDFAALHLYHTESKLVPGEMNHLLDVVYVYKERLRNLEKDKGSLVSLVKKEAARLEKKLRLYTASMDETADMEQYRLYGELLTANLYRLEKGQDEAVLENYYVEDSPLISIALDLNLTPNENSQAYFKKYLKAKNTREALESRIDQARSELAYLDGVKISLEQASDLLELAEVKQELQEQGYIRNTTTNKKNKQKDKLVPKPLVLHSSEGFQLLVGKNNKQNDYLTLKLARDEDIWLHTKDIPGAHVIIRTGGKKVPAVTLEEAASLAAFFSKGRESANVPVDYTLKKYVHKPRGSKPGMVIYERQRTIMASPDEKLIERLASTAQVDGV